MTGRVDSELTCHCGRAKTATQPYCKPCRQRWAKAGYPDTGPPPPVSFAEAGRRGAATKREAADEEKRPEFTQAEAETLAAQYQAWFAAGHRPQRQPAPIARSLAMCVAVSDAEGIRRLLNKYNDMHWSLPVALAANADPVLAGMIARTAPEPLIRRAARSACDLIPAVAAGDPARSADVIRRRAGTWEHYCALAIVLAESFTTRADERSVAA